MDLLKARELVEETVKAINSIEEKTDKSLALLRLLPVVAKVNNEIVSVVGEQAIKSINSISSPDTQSKLGKICSKNLDAAYRASASNIPVISGARRESDVGSCKPNPAEGD